MQKKYLRKNEIRTDLNPKHFNKYGKPHDAVITAKQGHKYKANTKTHLEYVNGVKCLDLEPGSLKPLKKHNKISPPFWQNENQFGEKQNKKVPKDTLKKIRKYNKKFY